MFTNRYLQSLRERYGHSAKQPRVTARVIPKVGQIVQIKGDTKNREEWKVGKITSLVNGSDGLCRIAKVEVGSKEFIRSLTHLYPLELEDNEEIELDENTSENGNEVLQNFTEHMLIPMEVEVIGSEDISDISESKTIEENSMLEDMDNVSESTDRENLLSQKEDQPEKSVQVNNGVKQRRGAATRALEKIAEWTRNLLTSF